MIVGFVLEGFEDTSTKTQASCLRRHPHWFQLCGRRIMELQRSATYRSLPEPCDEKPNPSMFIVGGISCLVNRVSYDQGWEVEGPLMWRSCAQHCSPPFNTRSQSMR